MTDSETTDAAIPSPEEFVTALRQALIDQGVAGSWLLGRIDDVLARRASDGQVTAGRDLLATYLDVLEDYLVVLPESLSRAEVLLTLVNDNSPVEVTIVPSDASTEIDVDAGYRLHDLFERSRIGDNDWTINLSLIDEVRASYGFRASGR